MNHRLIMLLVALLFIVNGQAAFAATDTIDDMSVAIVCDNGALPPRVAKRMENSVFTVGQHILLGHGVAEIAAEQNRYERLIEEVFDRVLVGYSVAKVHIVPGTTARVELVLVPWGDVVRDVKVEVNVAGVSPEMAELVKADAGDITGQVRDILVGLPVDAVDWAGSVSKSVVRESLEARLPEFHTSFDIVPGEHTVVRLALTPMGPTVQDINLSLRSQTIPNVLLLGAKERALESAAVLRGLPVSFVERHRDLLGRRIQDAADGGRSKTYELSVGTVVTPGVDTVVDIKADSLKYNVVLEGYVDLGREKNNTSARLHFGRYITLKDELFMQVDFTSSDVSWHFKPGWGHLIGQDTSLGIKYDIRDHDSILWLNQHLFGNFSLRAERIPGDGHNELGLRYKLHDFVSIEYVYTDDEKYLRLIGSL